MTAVIELGLVEVLCLQNRLETFHSASKKCSFDNLMKICPALWDIIGYIYPDQA